LFGVMMEGANYRDDGYIAETSNWDKFNIAIANLTYLNNLIIEVATKMI